jgi:phosphoribosyl-ATP pyrophosphohydrolase
LAPAQGEELKLAKHTKKNVVVPDPVPDPLVNIFERIRDGKQLPTRTQKLIDGGRAKLAQKVGEEAVEVALEAVQDNRAAVIQESADLIYHLAVLWADMGIPPDDVWQELVKREKLYGLAEKIAKSGTASADASRLLEAYPRRA